MSLDKQAEICHKKRSYSTKRIAKEALKAMNRGHLSHLRHKGLVGKWTKLRSVYNCPVCEEWHLSSKVYK